MKKNSNALSKLYSVLKNDVFKNQVTFYRLLFVMPRDIDEGFYMEMNSAIEVFLNTQAYNSLNQSSITTKFCRLLLDESFDTKDVNKSSISSIHYSDSAKTNTCNALKKNDASAIPKYWRKQYMAGSTQNNYKSILDSMLKFYVVVFCPEKIDFHTSKSKESLTFNEETWESLSQKIQSSNSTFSKIRSFDQFEDYIIKQIQDQCGHPEGNSIMEQWYFYSARTQGFGRRNLDKFYALEKYAETNIFCAFELAEIYYYGETFQTEDTRETITINPDHNTAAYYYGKCTKDNSFYAPGCWDLAFMYKNQLKGVKDAEKKCIELLRKCGNYAPAIHKLGLIDRNKGEEILNTGDYDTLNPELKRECQKYYLSFVEKAVKACQSEYVYSFINLYGFYLYDKYASIRKALMERPEYCELNPLYLVKEAAKMKNPWAIATLAMHYIDDYLRNEGYIDSSVSISQSILSIKSGAITLKDINIKKRPTLPKLLQKPKDLLESLERIGYARGMYHLAINFYYNEPRMGILLERAANHGHTQAMEMVKNLTS